MHEDVERWGNKQTEEIELLRKNEAFRKEFLQNLSHEFKTPLTSIRGYTETLLSGAMDDPKIAIDFLLTIERNAQHLEALVSDLLVLAKLEAEVPAKRERFELKPLIDEQISSRAKTLRDGGVQVMIECPPLQVIWRAHDLGECNIANQDVEPSCNLLNFAQALLDSIRITCITLQNMRRWQPLCSELSHKFALIHAVPTAS